MPDETRWEDNGTCKKCGDPSIGLGVVDKESGLCPFCLIKKLEKKIEEKIAALEAQRQKYKNRGREFAGW